jgi:hypothetical protein
MTDAMSETPRIVARICDYEGLREALRKWFLDGLQTTYACVDALASLPDGHAGKLFAPVPHARVGSKTLGPLLAAAGLELQLVVNEAQLERVRRHHDFRARSARAPYSRRHSDPSMRAARMRAANATSFTADTGKVAQARWMLATKAKQRSRWARAAALARWSKPKQEASRSGQCLSSSLVTYG